MIVISAGMQRSGSAWCFHITNDLLVACGYPDIFALRKQYGLESLLPHNCNIGALTLQNLQGLKALYQQNLTFVVKAHSPPAELKVFCSITDVPTKCVYIFRDPRDVVVSAFERGQHAKAKGNQSKGFGLIGLADTIENTIKTTISWLTIWEQWVNFDNVLLIRYENLVNNPLYEINRIVDYLELAINTKDRQQIIAKYQNQTANDKIGKTHFEHGIIGRFKDVLTPEEIALCNQYFDPYLKKMGYLI